MIIEARRFDGKEQTAKEFIEWMGGSGNASFNAESSVLTFSSKFSPHMNHHLYDGYWLLRSPEGHFVVVSDFLLERTMASPEHFLLKMDGKEIAWESYKKRFPNGFGQGKMV